MTPPCGHTERRDLEALRNKKTAARRRLDPAAIATRRRLGTDHEDGLTATLIAQRLQTTRSMVLRWEAGSPALLMDADRYEAIVAAWDAAAG